MWLNCLLCGVISIVCLQMGIALVFIIQSKGVSAILGCQCIEVYGEKYRTFESVHYIMVSAVERCPSYRVPL